MTKTKGNPDVRLAFRFIKMCIIAQHSVMPTPNWINFDEHDMFDSVILGSVTRVGYTYDGDSEVTRTLSFVLGDSVVAVIMLNGIQSVWGTASWTIDRAIYREHWNPDTGASGKTFMFDSDAFEDAFTTRVTVDA